MNFEVLSDKLRNVGYNVDAGVIQKSEAKARVSLSSYLALGASTESATAKKLYMERIFLDLPGAEETLKRVAIDNIILELMNDSEWSRLWSKVLPGSRQALELLQRVGCQTIVVSNSDGNVERRLSDFGLRDLLNGVVDSALVKVEKPNPGIFRHALAMANVSPYQALHVGDLYSVDVQGARAAGMFPVLVDPFDNWTRVECFRTDSVYSFAKELAKLRGCGSEEMHPQ